MPPKQQVYPEQAKAYTLSNIHPTSKSHNLCNTLPQTLGFMRLTFLSPICNCASGGRPFAARWSSGTAKVYRAARNADSCREQSRRSVHIAFDTCPRALAFQFSSRPTGTANRAFSKASVRAGSRLGSSSEHTRTNIPIEPRSSSERVEILTCCPVVSLRRIQVFPC